MFLFANLPIHPIWQPYLCFINIKNIAILISLYILQIDNLRAMYMQQKYMKS